MTGERSTRIREALSRELARGCAEGVFPGASACVGVFDRDGWRYVDAVEGVLAVDGEAVTRTTCYDLASVTKPWVAMTALRLYQAGVFPLGDSVEALIPEAAGHPVGAQPWERVLSHRSGLVAWEPFYERLPAAPGSEEARAWVLQDLLPRSDESQVSTSVYSDLGYILAGEALARAGGAPLDALIAQELVFPLGLGGNVFFGATHDGAWRDECAPTGRSVWRQRELVGEVHDDNCAALGGVAGHAGMFGTARGVTVFGASWVSALHGRRGALDEDAIRFATARRPGGSHLLGWDGKSDEGSAAGEHIDGHAFGHLGFTGTSLWCDPRRELVMVLLTNRVAASDDNAAIRAFRPRFHDAVVDAFDDA